MTSAFFIGWRLPLCWAVAALFFALQGDSRGASKVDFNRDIRPILSDKCFACHGPDEAERKGGKRGARLRLDTSEGARADIGDRFAVVPGKPEMSELVKRIKEQDVDEVMPPASTGKKLSAADVALLERWVREGASYARHWSYEKPVRTALPKVRAKSWPKNEIDFFILHRLEAEKLKPSPEADRAALIRRVALDLTGLPPAPREVEEFLADQAPGAYERLVDRLLARESFGEHWARMWLDLARYADSAGYADDPARTIWAYRDYVIRSFNENKPFDRFTIEQLAGDLLPDGGEEELIATAFHRNTPTNNEGGTNDEEFRNVAIVDRVNTTMAAWMGATMACAQCHTHKYDPITQEEYFKVFAIFNNTEDADRTDESPTHAIWTEEQKKRRAELEPKIAALEKVVSTATPELKAAQEEWEKRFATEVEWSELEPKAVKSKEGAEVKLNGAEVSVGRKGKTDIYTIEVPIVQKTKLAALRLEALADETLPKKGPGHGGGNFVISRVVVNGAEPIEIAAAYATFSQEKFEAGSIINNKDVAKKGWAVSPKFGESHTLTLVPKETVELAAGSTLTVTIEQLSQYEYATLGKFRLSAAADERASEFARTPADVAGLLRKADRNDEESAKVRKFYLSIAPALKTEREQLAGLKKEYEAIKPVTTAPIFRELASDKRRKTQIQLRGNFMNLGQEVSAGVPAAFHPIASPEPDRLAFAKWLVDPNNPLTARVAVNRYWESIFGIGLVSTSEDFGVQGELPSHPELLDWLATEYVRLGWDTKALLRLMVTSAAYRQSSRVTPDLLARDPENRLLARGPRFRLSAEMIRDQALGISGLLSPKMHGPPVKPPQPKLGLNAAFGSATDWEASAGEDRYRRAIYTTWRRSNPYPSMATFDAPNREVCTVRRERSNTPLQALVTLNDPVYVEAAQALARRLKGQNVDEKIERAFLLCVARKPTKVELAKVAELYARARLRYAGEKEKAVAMATKPLGALHEGADAEDLAAWTVVANVLLNLDETLMKR